eukprot:3598249-Prymnesium_polylepis.1
MRPSRPNLRASAPPTLCARSADQSMVGLHPRQLDRLSVSGKYQALRDAVGSIRLKGPQPAHQTDC